MAQTDIGAITVRIKADTTDVVKGVDVTNETLKKNEKRLKKNQKAWRRWSGAVKIAAAVVGGIMVTSTIKFSDAVTTINNKLKLATKSTVELTKVTDELFQISNAAGTGILSSVDLYAKLERSTRNAELGTKRLLKVTSSITKAFAISGATTAESAGSIRQLGQALASGKLSGDEFNSIAEQAPIIMEAIKVATGKTAGELKKLGSQGKITSEVLIESIERYKDVIDRDHSTAIKTFSQNMEIAQNEVIKFLSKNDAIPKAVAAAGKSIVVLSENMDLLVAAGQAFAIVYGASFVGRLYAANAALIATNFSATIATRGLFALAGAANFATKSFALLGGPVGVLIAAAAALALFVDWETDAEKETKKTNKAINEQIEALQGLNAAQLDVENKKFAIAQAENLKAVSELTDKINKATEAQEKLREQHRQSTPEFSMNARKIIDMKEALQGLFEAQSQIQKLGGAIFEQRLESKLPTEDPQKLIDIEAKAKEAQAKAEAEALAKVRLEAAEKTKEDFELRFLTEEQNANRLFAADLARLKDALELKTITQAEYNSYSESLEEEHQKKLSDIKKKKQQLDQAIFQKNAVSILNSLQILGKNSVKIQKGVALASAGIAIATGIARAQELGWPANIAEMIRVAAVGVSAIRSIRSANVGSASIPAGAAGGIGGSTMPTQQPQQPAPQIQRNIDLNIVGNGIFTRDQVIGLMEQINDVSGDGFNIRTTGGN